MRRRSTFLVASSLLVAFLLFAALVPVVRFEESSSRQVEVSYEVTATSTVKALSSPRLSFRSKLVSSEGILHDAKFTIDWSISPVIFFSQPELWFIEVEVTISEGLSSDYVWTHQEAKSFMNEIRNRLVRTIAVAPFLASLGPAKIVLVYRELVAGYLKEYGVAITVPPKTAVCSYNGRQVWVFIFKMEGAAEPVTSWGIGFGTTAFAWVLLPLTISPTMSVKIFDVETSDVETIKVDYVKSVATRIETRTERRTVYITLVQYLLKVLFP